LNGVTTNQLQGAEEPVVKAMHTLVQRFSKGKKYTKTRQNRESK